jgi:FAD/FMN-containing dehydrogenase
MISGGSRPSPRAGGLAYWLDPIAIDLVGLNTEETALRGATPDYIEELNADLIMIHHGGLLATGGCDGDNLCVLDKQPLREATPPEWEDRGQSSNRVVQAIYSAITYLNQAPEEWQIYLARYQGYSHLYAVRRDGVITQQSFVGALRASFSEQGRGSHLEMTQRLARPNH